MFIVCIVFRRFECYSARLGFHGKCLNVAKVILPSRRNIDF